MVNNLKKKVNMKKTKRYLSFIKKVSCIFLFIFSLNLIAQTPGLIYEGTDPNGVLDPNGDGYTSKPPSETPSQFTNIGFPANVNMTDVFDILYSEIEYVGFPIIEDEPLSDISKGSSCGFTDMVADANGNTTYYKNDGTNMMFRFRLGGTASNSKGYSVLIDTDEKFGFDGPNKDPNAVPGNPGFEVEIVLRTNFQIDAFNIDGTTNGTIIPPVGGVRTYSDFAIKSLAVTTACDDPDYFYDFYVPFSDLVGFIDTSSKLRMVGLTVINPGQATGSNGVSDIAGVDDSTGTIDNLVEQIIDNQTPTDGDPIERTDCPQITGGNNTPSIVNGDTEVQGTSTEADGTVIQVFVNDTPHGSTTTVLGGLWKQIGLTLTTGDVVKATALAESKGLSEDNCDVTSVLGAACTPLSTPSFSSYTSGGRILNLSYSAGTPSGSSFIFNFYDSSSGAQINTINGVNVVNFLSTSATQVDLGGGKKFTDDNLNFIVKIDTNPPTCESLGSEPISTCTSGGASATPFLDPIEVGANTITGNFGGSPPTSATLVLIINGSSTNYTATTTSSSNTFSFNVSGLTLSTSDAIKVSNRNFGTACISTLSSVVNPSTPIVQSLPPVVSGDYCTSTNVDTVSGTSNESSGTIIRVYTKNSAGVTTSDTFLGSTAVSNSGVWTLSSLNIPAGNFIAATAQNGSETVSNLSNEVQITQKTSFTTLVITTDPITEGDASISGTSSGLLANSVIKLFLDGSEISGVTDVIDGSGNWVISGLDAPIEELYAGAQVTVVAEEPGKCNSDFSNSKTVQCKPPNIPNIEAVSTSPICEGGIFDVRVLSAETGVIYQIFDQNDNAIGPAKVGPNPSANLILSSDPILPTVTSLKVKASRIGIVCLIAESNPADNISISVNPSPTLTLGANPSASFSSSPQTLLLDYSASTNSPVLYNLDFDSAANGAGLVDVNGGTLNAAPSSISINVPANLAVGVYNANLVITETTNGCSKSYPITVTIVDASTPTINLTNTNVTLCSGTITANFSYSSTTNSPTKYSINFSDAANLKGFTDIVDSNLPTSPIVVSVPANLEGGVYFGILTVKNNGNKVSSEYQITITNNTPNGGTIASNQTITENEDVAAFTSTVNPIGEGTLTYQWQKSTTNATTGFSDISGATSLVYDEGNISQTTYYKRIVTSTLNGITCTADSNVLAITTTACVPPDVSGFNTTVSDITTGATATVVVSANSLPNGTYTINYTISGANTFAATDVSMNVTAGNSGSFNTPNLNNNGSTTVTINSITLGCTSLVSSGNTDTFQVSALEIDLNITKTVDKAVPKKGQTIIFTLQLTNSGDNDAAGVQVKDLLPVGLTYNAAASTIPVNTTYTAGTGIWDLSAISIAKNTTIELKIAATVTTTGAIITNTAEIFKTEQKDLDSFPNSEN